MCTFCLFVHLDIIFQPIYRYITNSLNHYACTNSALKHACSSSAVLKNLLFRAWKISCFRNSTVTILVAHCVNSSVACIYCIACKKTGKCIELPLSGLAKKIDILQGD